MLRSKCRQAISMAAFHFAMEAAIKKNQQKLEILQVGNIFNKNKLQKNIGYI